MGKAEKVRRGKGPNPTGLPSRKEAEKLVEPPQQLPIIQQLSSTDKMDRELACSVIANVVLEGPQQLGIVLVRASSGKAVLLLLPLVAVVVRRGWILCVLTAVCGLHKPLAWQLRLRLRLRL